MMREYLRWIGKMLFVGLAIAAVAPVTAQESEPGARGRTGIRLPGGRNARPDAGPNAAAPTQRPAATPPRGATTAPPATAATSPKSPASTLDIVQGKGGTQEITMEFYGLDIDHLLRLLMKAAHVTILKDSTVTGPFTIIAPDRVSVDVAFQIVNSALEMRGWTMMKTDLGLYKVVPVTQALQSGPPVRFGDRPEDLPAGDQIITQVIPLKNLGAADVASQMRPLMSDQARVVATSTNSLIITDTASNLSRVMAMISQLESELADGYRVFPLENYDATEMASLVTSIVLNRGGAQGGATRAPFERAVVAAAQQPGAAGQAATRRTALQSVGTGAGPEFCYPDTRTNCLIVLATPIHQQQIAGLVEQLDRPVSLRDSYYVYPVQNLVASQLAQLVGPLVNAQVQTLSGAGQPSTTGGATSSTQRAGPGATGFGGQTGTFRGGGGFRSSGFQTQGLGALPGASEGSAAGSPRLPEFSLEPLALESSSRGAHDRGEAAPPSGAEPIVIAQAPEGVPPGPPTIVFMPAAPGEGGVSGEEQAYSPGTYGQAVITADDNTNTILISAPPEQMDLIKQLLEKLDVLPPQVHIQAIIAEVALTRDTSLGFQWEGLKALYRNVPGGAFTGTIGTEFGVIPTDSSGDPVTPSGLTAMIAGPDEFQAVINALTSDSHARILSAPGIFTTNNVEGYITVSSSRPFPTGSFTSAAGSSTMSVNYQPVGIQLRVTPRVTQSGFVQMQVNVMADEPGLSVIVAGESYPTTNTRQATATLSVADGHTVILGGLMRDGITRTASRVPLLGDLPLIGALFRSTTSKREKSELLVFLTPHVVRTAEEAARVTEDQKSKLPELPKSLQRPADGSAPPK